MSVGSRSSRRSPSAESTPEIERRWAGDWSFPSGVDYLNHGSFGPSPAPVRRARAELLEALDAEPMDFLIRRLPTARDEARRRLAGLIGASPDDLLFCDNATTGMNLAANCVARRLRPGDEVLCSDHEYGAVMRLWGRVCREAGAQLVVRPIECPVGSSQQIVQTILEGVTPRTRALVLSHVTSPTALIFPVEEICREVRRRGIVTCIDGPHALAMLPLHLSRLGCDFYAASCHKWLSAPLGSGFLYVAPEHQPALRPLVTSWGRPDPGCEPRWQNEFDWSGTRDPTPALTLPAAIEYLEGTGWGAFRHQGHALAEYARRRITEWTGLPALAGDGRLFGTMVACPLPPGPCQPLMDALRSERGIEVPIVDWNQRRLVRVSCHWYNSPEQIDRLLSALQDLVPRFPAA